MGNTVAMRRELVVTDDIPEAAARLFREAMPRTIVLAGGETPRPTYQRLAREEHDWDQVEVFFSDERCVPPDHPDSNYRMANETLLFFVPARVHRMPGEGCDAESYERELRRMFADSLPRFDLAFMGLGPDGHTASLFPGDPALDEKERWVVRVSRPDHERMTLTLPLLSAVRLVVFLVAGEEKHDALRRMMAGEDIPANRVAAERVVVLADAAAASGVEGR
jgi:6-phosphogluconolactonase